MGGAGYKKVRYTGVGILTDIFDNNQHLVSRNNVLKWAWITLYMYTH